MEEVIAAAKMELLMKIGKSLPKVDKFFYAGHGLIGRLISKWVYDTKP